MKKKELRVRCWIEIDGTKFFGPGPAELIERIQKEGSIAKAAKEMGMSYKKAWDIIENLNTRSKLKLVNSFKGGIQGGRAQVTEHGQKIVVHYRKLNDKLNKLIRKEGKILKLI